MAMPFAGLALRLFGGRALRLWPVYVLGDRFSGVGCDPARNSRWVTDLGMDAVHFVTAAIRGC